MPTEDKKAVAYILHSLKIPETEWQIGKTKVFLRHTVFEPLEERRRELLTEKMIIIQKVWRGYRIRKRYKEMRRACIIIQTYFRGRRERLMYLRKRRAAILIQAHMRGVFARELVEEIRRKKREEEERLRRLRQEEEERKRKEETRRRAETEERAREEAFKIAQKELITLAEIANKKAEKTVDKKGQVNLDEMFTFLAEPSKPKENEEKDFLSDLTHDLEAMFQASDGARQPMHKPMRTAPDPPSSSKNALTRTDQKSSRDLRRQRRVRKKLLGIDDDTGRGDEPFDPTAYPLIKFAEMYFNDFPRDSGAFSTMSLRRLPKSIRDAIPKQEMLVYTKANSLPTSMVHMHEPENVNLACSIFKDLCKLLRGDTKNEQINLVIQSTIAYGIDRSELRDEIFCQLIRQVTENPREDGILRGWHFLTLCTIAFPPSKNFNKVCVKIIFVVHYYSYLYFL